MAAVVVPIDKFVETKLIAIRACLGATPPDIEHALYLVESAILRQQLDDQEMCRLRHEIAQYSELTKDLLLESGTLRTQLEDANLDMDRMDKERAEANRRCTAALVELKTAQKMISKLEACLGDRK